MASSLAKSTKSFRRLVSRNKHSWWWDSHISPKNSKWLAENLEKMDQSVKRMLKLIEEEEEGDSFAKKAQIYYQRRPELVSQVEEFYRMYRALAERYDHITGELRKNIPSDLQSQGSGSSDVGSEPPVSSTLDLGTKEGDEMSTLDSESESDDLSVNNYSSAAANSDHTGLRNRIAELESELQKLQMQQEEKVKNDNIVEELRVRNEKLESELQKYDQELASKECQLDDLSQHLDQLHLEHVELVDRITKSNKSIEELTSRGEELKKEISRQREVIKEGAEEKREVIRQLCFSLEHYRDGYQMMRQTFLGHNKRHPVMAS